MFISFPAMISEWIELSSLASSLRNDALSDKHVESIAEPGRTVCRIFKGCVKFLLFLQPRRGDISVEMPFIRKPKPRRGGICMKLQLNNGSSCVLGFESVDTIGGIHFTVHIDLHE